jgi:hypothetical protein
MSKTRLAKSILVLILMLSLVCVVIGLWAFVNRRKAKHLLAEVQDPRWALATFEDARNLSEKYGGHAVGHGLDSPLTPEDYPANFGCNKSRCRFSIAISNTPLFQLHLAPRTELFADLQVEGNRVTRIAVGLMSLNKEKGEDFELAVDVSDEFCYPCYDGQQPYSTRFGWDYRSQRPFGLMVRLTPASTPAQRHSAYDLNLACLTRFGGCKDARALSPELWDRTELEKLK